MTDAERKLVTLLVQAVDAILSAHADGCGMHEFCEMRREWLRESQPVRMQIDAEYTNGSR